MSVQESFTRSITDNKWVFKADRTHAQMKYVYDVLRQKVPAPAGLAMSAASYTPAEPNAGVEFEPQTAGRVSQSAAPIATESSEVKSAKAEMHDAFVKQNKQQDTYMMNHISSNTPTCCGKSRPQRSTGRHGSISIRHSQRTSRHIRMQNQNGARRRDGTMEYQATTTTTP